MQTFSATCRMPATRAGLDRMHRILWIVGSAALIFMAAAELAACGSSGGGGGSSSAGGSSSSGSTTSGTPPTSAEVNGALWVAITDGTSENTLAGGCVQSGALCSTNATSSPVTFTYNNFTGLNDKRGDGIAVSGTMVQTFSGSGAGAIYNYSGNLTTSGSATMTLTFNITCVGGTTLVSGSTLTANQTAYTLNTCYTVQ